MSSLVKSGWLVLPSNLSVIYVIVLQLQSSSLDEMNRIAIHNKIYNMLQIIQYNFKRISKYFKMNINVKILTINDFKLFKFYIILAHFRLQF